MICVHVYCIVFLLGLVLTSQNGVEAISLSVKTEGVWYCIGCSNST